jgi:hypothetical protein
MANQYLQGRSLQRIRGINVPRAAAVVPASTVSTPYWTVAGGLVLVTSLIGIVTAAGDSTATTLLFSAVPTVGAANNMCGASASMASAAIGCLVSVDGTAITTAMQSSGVTAGGNIGGMAKPIVVGIGTINMVTANTNATLALRWLLTYIPLDDGASVVAA